MARNEKNEVTFFIDRSLGKSIAVALRAVGLEVLTMADVYGEKTAQTLKDEVWLHDAGTAGWVVLTKDDAIRRRPAERDALEAAGARVFCLTAAQLRGAEQATWLVENRHRILRQCRKPGPYIYGVYEKRIARLWPR